MNHSTLFVSTLILAAACAPDAPLEGCSNQGDLQRGLRIHASLTGPSIDDQTGLEIVETSRVECAEVTITQPGTTWSWTGTTPTALAIAPGDYEVEVAWSGHEMDYRSQPAAIRVDGSRELTLPLCADLSGDWTCEDGDRTWAMEATMDSACGVAFSDREGRHGVYGQMVSSSDVSGSCAVGDDLLLTDLHDGVEARCTRS